MDDLHQIDEWLAALLANLEPSARQKMLRELAQDVRRIQQNNITAQRAPDGSAWEPRRVTARTKKGRIRRKMFTKLKTAKYLKVKADADGLEVFFTNQVQRLARVHHYGLRDRVNKSGIEIKYTARQLLGVDSEVKMLTNNILYRWLIGE